MSLQAILLAPLIVILLLVLPAGLVVYLRYRGLPRYPGLVFPANAAEAERVTRHWQRHNRDSGLLADVRLLEGGTLHNVLFDPDSLVAVRLNDEPLPVWYYRRAIHSALLLEADITEARREAFARGEWPEDEARPPPAGAE